MRFGFGTANSRIQNIGKYLVRMFFYAFLFPTAHNGFHPHSAHIVMTGQRTDLISFLYQIRLHLAISRHAVFPMIDSNYTIVNLAGTFLIFFFAVFQIIIIRIGTDGKFPKQPTHTELLMIFLDELILC
jgi:hypothetical protein